MELALLSFWSAIPAAVAVFAALFVYDLSRKLTSLQTWKSQGVPGPEPWFYLWSLIRMILPNFHLVDGARIKKYGKVFGVYDGSVASLVIADPLLLKEMLVRNFASFSNKRDRPTGHRILSKFLSSANGEAWRQARHIISPTFTSGKMKAMFPVMSDASDLMKKVIQKNEGSEFNLKDLFGCLTMDIIAKCAFAIDPNAHANEDSPFVANAKGLFRPSYWRGIAFVLTPTFITKLFGLRQSSEHMDYLISLAEGMVAERRKQMRQGDKSNRYNDLLQLMIDAAADENEDPVDGKALERNSLTDEEIVANTVLFLIAGYETTATLLTYTVYSLACNPHVQERLRQEVKSAEQLDYDTVMKLPYLDAVINESLRMHPPVIRIERMVSSQEGYTFDSEHGKIHMPHGTGIIAPIYAIHHMEEYFPEHDKFEPERFMPENKDKLVPYSMLSFSMGPRNCVGMRFALLEAKLALASLISEYKVSPTANTDIPLDLSRSVILLSPKRVIVKIEKLARDS